MTHGPGRIARRATALLAPLALVAVTLGVQTVTGRAAADAGTGLSVIGNQLMKDGAPYLPRGFNSIGLLTPSWCGNGSGRTAAAHFGQAEMDAATSWNANTLRFQVSQRGLADPTIAQADRDAYLASVVAGVALARRNGFTVVLSMQDQSIGCGSAHKLPFDQTLAAWQVLAPAVDSDPYVMFELFNEPTSTNDAAGWSQWADGGTGPQSDQGAVPVGHQQLLDAIRGLGATNVVIAEGLTNNGMLAGLTPLSDPTGNLVYGIHPYYIAPGQPTWDADFGDLTATYPVIATEWNYTSNKCGTKTETLAPSFLQYLAAHDIGLLVHAIDVPNTVVTADWTWTPTDCATASGGAGRVVHDYFASQAGPRQDTGPPTAPGQLAAVMTAGRAVSLTWQASVDDIGVTGYQIWRDGRLAATTTAPGYTDTTVSPATSYAYTVVALDAVGNVSAPSNEADVTTPPSFDQPPTAPTGVWARLVSPTSVSLTWAASSDDRGITGYQVRRDGVLIASVTTAAGYTDTTMTSGQSHSYVVSAVDTGGNVTPSSPASVSVPPVAAAGLTGTYYATATLQKPVLTRVDRTLSFSWGTGAPAPGVPKDRFSVRWSGNLIPRTNQTYTFSLASDQGARLWVDGQLVIDDWTAHALRTDTATVALQDNRAYSLQVEYYDSSGAATAVLSWSTPTIGKSVIPSTQLLAR